MVLGSIEGRRDGTRPNPVWVLLALAVTLNLARAVSLVVVERPPGSFNTLWDGWVHLLALAVPAVAVWLRARTDDRNQVAWSILTVGIVCNLLGELVYTFHDQNQDPVPFPGFSDVFYLASYVAFLVTMVLLTQRSLGPSARVARLDGLIVGLAAGAAAVALWFDVVLEQSGSPAAVAVGMAYPLFNVVVVVLATSGLTVAGFRPSASVLLFILGAQTMAVGDVIFLRQIAAGAYVPNTLLEVTWSLGIVLFCIAPWVRSDRPKPHPVSVLASVTLPGLASVAALVVIAWGIATDIPQLAMWMSVGAIATVLARVGLTVRELRRATDAFRQARTDEMTGLLNRRGFAEELDRRLAQDAPLLVMLIDLNGFKEINDSLGHQAGDQLLVVVAQRFARAIPPNGLLARLGGDEFGVAVNAAGQNVDAKVGNALLDSLDEPISLDGVTVRVGASIGVSSSLEHGTTRAELVRAADVAMYDAKANQRGVARYRVDRDPHSREQLALLEELRNAIERREFQMHYQPTIDVLSGSVVGMEALVRWQHPARGLLPPADFVPLAERVGLIPALTRSVLDLSVAHLSKMRRDGYQLRLSVNISAKDLADDGLPTYVRSTLAAHEVPAHALTLEITETAVAVDLERASRVLNELRADGVRVSIDDFGVGYSSMSQLLQLPLDELKLDRSFIANLDRDVRAQAVLAAAIELGRTLGLAVVAEGVEHSAAMQEVIGRGVDIAQGYYFSPALDPADFEEFLRGVETPDLEADLERFSSEA